MTNLEWLNDFKQGYRARHPQAIANGWLDSISEDLIKLDRLKSAAMNTLAQQRKEFARGEIADLNDLEDALSQICEVTQELAHCREGFDEAVRLRVEYEDRLDLLRKMALEGEDAAVLAGLTDEATMQALLDGDRDMAQNFPDVERLGPESAPDPATTDDLIGYAQSENTIEWHGPQDDCGECYECLKDKTHESGLPMTATRMIVCPVCGNKRCPRATWHWNACTDSNEPGQPGSRYERVSERQEMKHGLTEHQVKAGYRSGHYDELDGIESCPHGWVMLAGECPKCEAERASDTHRTK